MSLGKNTKCDLSAGQAKLDITELTRQIELRFYSLVELLKTKTQNIMYNSLTEKDRKDTVSSMSCYGSDELLKISIEIAKTTELLYTLQEREGREITLV